MHIQRLMLKICPVVFFSCLLFSPVLYAQKISFSPQSSHDNSNIHFEIIGKQGTGYWIYKNKQRAHFLCRYNNNMELIEEKELYMLPEKTIDVDLYTTKNGLMLICQYKQQQQVFCQFIRLDTAGLLAQKPVFIDSVIAGGSSNARIYSSVCSDDKKKLLIYKRHIRSGILYFSAFILTSEGALTDHYNNEAPFNRHQLFAGNCVLSNSGDWAYLQEHRKADEDDIYELTLKFKANGDSVVQSVAMPLDGNWISQPMLKADNLNNSWLINAFYRTERRGKAAGLYTVIINRELVKKEGYNPFLQIVNNSDNPYAYNNIYFDNLTPAQVIIKKNGGFMLIAEDNYTETYSNQQWNRNYYYNDPYSFSNDYFYSNAPYYGYRPFNNYNNYTTTRYHSGDVFMLSIDSSIQLEWNNIINKKQSDSENENFLSYGWLNAGKEIHLFFIANQNQKDIVSHQAITSSGVLSRFPTVKSEGIPCQFMPRLSKQTGNGSFIMPFILQNKLGFALVDYTAH